MKKTLTTLWLAASLALSWAPKANAQIDKNNDETQHKIENVFTKSGKEAQNFMQDTTNIQEIKNLLKDEEFVRKLTNDERIKPLLKEYNLNEKDVEKFIEDIINSDVAIWVIKENLKNKDINKIEKKSDKKVLIIWIIGWVLLSLLLFFPELFVKRR